MSDIKYQPGTIMPDEYDWQEQFSLDPSNVGHDPYISMDVGKVRGLAIAHQSLRAELERKEAELAKYREVVPKMARLMDCMPDWIAEELKAIEDSEDGR